MYSRMLFPPQTRGVDNRSLTSGHHRPEIKQSDGPSFLKDGKFKRPESGFRNFVSRDPNSEFPAEKGRYALYIAPGCPWVRT